MEDIVLWGWRYLPCPIVQDGEVYGYLWVPVEGETAEFRSTLSDREMRSALERERRLTASIPF